MVDRCNQRNQSLSVVRNQCNQVNQCVSAVLTISALSFLSNAGFSQTLTIKGKIINEKSREALPFVNIVVKNTHRGTTSDVEGRFTISVNEKEQELSFSYLGFETFIYRAGTYHESFIVIGLKEKPTELHEVVIHPGENPAFRIIRNATRNKPLNDPENLPSFTYHSYNKLFLAAEGTSDSAKNEKEQRFKNFAERHNLFVGESYTERKFVSPNLSKETVLANQVSGVKDPFFSFLATDFQPFSFYKDFIVLFNMNYLNPISEGSTEKYDFTLLDTVYHGADSVFVIAFEPLPGKTFEALKGQLYISSDGYALEHVLAQLADDMALIEYRIQQKYEKIDEHWFPIQLNSELRFKEYQFGTQKLVYISRSYLSDVVIGPEISKKEFGLLNVEFDPIANHRPPGYWDAHRADTLGKKEKNTYHFYDSLGPSLNALNTVMKTAENLVLGRFKAGWFYLPLEYLVRFNQYEGSRLGVGLQTGERISKFIVLEGFVGYGIKDRALKYGGSLQFNILPSKEGFLRYSYKQDVGEPGNSNFIRSPITGNESLRHWLAYRMDSILQHKVEFSIRPVRFSQVSFFAQRQQRTPTYTYSFITEKDALGKQKNFVSTEVGLEWRFAWKESYIQIGNGKAVTKIAYPQINLYASEGIGIWNGQYNFTKLETRIDQQWIIRGLGLTTLQFDAGKITGKVPYPFLFNGKGSHFDNSLRNSIVVSNYFQTMGLYEFASDQFAYLFLNHNFGRITGNKSKYVRPELALVQNLGVGSLQNNGDHMGIEFKTMNKGFFESGLMFNNLFRFNYLSLVYFGVGLGTFYRYGSYALPKTSDNFAYKLIISLSF